MDKKIYYTINSSVYGMFNNIVFDDAVIKINLLNFLEEQICVMIRLKSDLSQNF